MIENQLHGPNVPIVPIVPAQAREVGIDWAAHVYAGLTLASQVAGLIGTEPRDAANCIWDMPLNLQPMLCSPEGWQVLAGYIAESMGRPMAAFDITIH